MAKRSRAEFSATELLDDKFQSMQDAYGMSDTLVLPARVKKEKGAKAPPPPPQTRHERRKSKSQEKKIAKLEVRVGRRRRESAAPVGRWHPLPTRCRPAAATPARLRCRRCA